MLTSGIYALCKESGPGFESSAQPQNICALCFDGCGKEQKNKFKVFAGM